MAAASSPGNRSDRPGSRHVAAVMVPLPAQGHLNQLLHLSVVLSGRGVPVYFASTSTHVRQARVRDHGSPSSAAAIRFHEFQLPPFENPQPDPSGPNRFPNQIVPALMASTHLRRPVFELVAGLSVEFRRVAVIHDVMMSYVVQDICSIANAELFRFRPLSAFTCCSWLHGFSPEFPPETELLKLSPSMDGYYSRDFGDFLELQYRSSVTISGEIYNSNDLIEGPFLDLLRNKTAEKIWALGPFNPCQGLSRDSKTPDSNILTWLDNQAPNSVIFVSFGTTASFSDDQIKEIAIGLEKSEHRFIWALRAADRGDIFTWKTRQAELPDGFEIQVQDRGLIVRDWVPQLEILGHGSTGGFLTHCGWNSCLEGICAGVPMATWPLHSDQPGNAVLITKALRIGVEVKAWSRQDQVVASDVVARAVREVLECDEIRKRAAELGEAVRRSVGEAGSAWKAMGSFVEHIGR